jgi:hypothetical protein
MQKWGWLWDRSIMLSPGGSRTYCPADGAARAGRTHSLVAGELRRRSRTTARNISHRLVQLALAVTFALSIKFID